MNEIMRRVRPEEWERRIIFMPSEVRRKILLKKYKISTLKFIVYLLNCTLGPPNLGVKGFFLLKSAERCIRDSPYMGQGGPWPPCPVRFSGGVTVIALGMP